MFKGLVEEIDSNFRRDPALRSRLEVVFCYPGFHAILVHRGSHAMWRRGWRLPARMLAHLGRFLTGIEIHPGAHIGRRLFIDHGMGIVIGETAEVADDVTLYHGVTLGGTSWQTGKRHPTLESGVVVGAGAKVLGPVTIHAGAKVGSNAVVLKDVPAGVAVVGIPARVVPTREEGRKSSAFAAYGTPTPDIPDPINNALNGLLERVSALGARVVALEEELARRPAANGHDLGADEAVNGAEGDPPAPTCC